MKSPVAMLNAIHSLILWSMELLRASELPLKEIDAPINVCLSIFLESILLSSIDFAFEKDVQVGNDVLAADQCPIHKLMMWRR